MNIQKIFNAVDEDEMNSPLSSVIYEIEQQGYKVKLEGLEVSAGDMEEKLFEDYERATDKFEIELLKNNKTEQRFNLIFTDHHKFSFQKV